MSPPLAEGTANMNPLFWGLTPCYHQKLGHYLTEGHVLTERHDSELLTEETRCLKYGRIKQVESGEKRMSKTKVSRAEGPTEGP